MMSDSSVCAAPTETRLFLETEAVAQNLSHAAKGLLVVVRVEVLHLNMEKGGTPYTPQSGF